MTPTPPLGRGERWLSLGKQIYRERHKKYWSYSTKFFYAIFYSFSRLLLSLFILFSSVPLSRPYRACGVLLWKKWMLSSSRYLSQFHSSNSSIIQVDVSEEIYPKRRVPLPIYTLNPSSHTKLHSSRIGRCFVQRKESLALEYN